MLTILMAFAQRHIFKIIFVVVAVMVVLGAYVYGYQNGKYKTELAYATAIQEETERRERDIAKERARIRKLQDIIAQLRKKDPINDARDSCILSNDPYSVDCTKEGK